MSGGFHSTPEQYFEYGQRSIIRGLEEGRLTEDDADILREYVAERFTQISPSRASKTSSLLVTSRRFFPRYMGATKTDFLTGFGRLRHAKKEDGEPYAHNSIVELLNVARMFFEWMVDRGYVDITKDVIRSAKTPAFNMATKNEDDILDADEIVRLIDTAKSLRYKALIGVMYEAGLRASEAAALQWKDITFYEWGARIRTDGKTGKKRTVPIIMYRELLANWRSSYPGDPVGDAYVFLSNRGTPLKYNSVLRSVRNFARDAGIKRKIGLHTFRHSRITHVLRDGMQETLAKKAFWGNQSTPMIATYSHLVDEDLDAEFCRLAGVELPEEAQVNGAPEPVQCPNCHLVMPPGSRFCSRCGMTLTAEAAETVNAVIKAAEAVVANPNDPEALTILLEARARMARGE